MIFNPEYKGRWEPRTIKNPAYKGPWRQPKIDNPDFFSDTEPHYLCNPCTHLGIEIWQVTAGSIFDSILVTDDVDYADDLANDLLDVMSEEQEQYAMIKKTKYEMAVANKKRRDAQNRIDLQKMEERKKKQGEEYLKQQEAQKQRSKNAAEDEL